MNRYSVETRGQICGNGSLTDCINDNAKDLDVVMSMYN